MLSRGKILNFFSVDLLITVLYFYISNVVFKKKHKRIKVLYMSPDVVALKEKQKVTM